ncbi:MAG: preprotein translocase subunit SecE [Bacteriovoracaceae bacterium]|jgi:preprotein translocase subunit SecE|nr:preprotein translocase subunit SecE [Bacteriovoracaceae bacterium]
MSVSAENGKKWIQASVAIVCMVTAYVMIAFFETMGDWFELEAKVSNFTVVAQALGVLIGLGSFIYIVNNSKTSTFLNEVYAEVTKVVWPNREDTNKQTIVIMILVTIIGFILGFFDFIAAWALSLIN